MKNVIAGLDIGTSKICAAIAGESDVQDELLGLGVTQSKGINKGFVSNLDKLIDSISEALGAAQEKAGMKVQRVVADISGSSVSGNVHENVMFLSRRGREITKRDVKKALNSTRNTSMTMERDILFDAPHEFVIDDSHEAEDPVGLFGSKLKARLYVISALTTHVQNISKAVNYAGYELVDIIPGSVAASFGILKDEQKKDGSFLVDMGGGITEMALISNNRFQFLDSINVGGMDLTACISSHYKIPFGKAETVKRRYGAVSKEEIAKAQQNIIEFDDRQIVVKGDEMNRLLKKRFEEMFNIIRERLTSAKTPAQFSRVVATGGGFLLQGAIESLEELLGAEVGLGHISGMKGDPAAFSNPIYSTAISLAKYGLHRYKRKPIPIEGRIFFADLFSRFKNLMDEYF